MSAGAHISGPIGKEPMGAGVALSAAVHGAVLLAAVFGVDFLSRDTAEVMVFEDVALISGPEFDAAISKAPEAPKSLAPAMAAPSPAPDAAPDRTAADAAPTATDEFVVGDVTDEEMFPDLSAVLVPLARAKVRPAQIAALVPAAPAFGEAPPAPMTFGMPAMRSPGAPAPQTMSGARRGASLRIDTAPPPPEDRVAPEAQPKPDTLSRADTPIAANTPDPDAPPEAPVEEALKAAAPEAAVEEVVTEADLPEEDASPAPMESAIPVGRPEGRAKELAAAAAAAAEVAEAEVAEAEAAEAEAAEAAKTAAAAKPAEAAATTPDVQTAGASAEAAGADLQLGVPITSTEKSGLEAAISKKWNTSTLERYPDFEEVVVTMRITLGRDGRIIGKPEMIRPASAADPRFEEAERRAAAALMQVQPYDDHLPAGKYARWRQVEVTFRPGAKEGEGVSM